MNNPNTAPLQDRRIEWPTHDKQVLILHGDTRELIRSVPDNSVQCAITSPPYWGVRDYGVADQIGAESDLTRYIDSLVELFREVRRTLTPDGTLRWTPTVGQLGIKNKLRT